MILNVIHLGERYLVILPNRFHKGIVFLLHFNTLCIPEIRHIRSLSLSDHLYRGYRNL